MIIKYFSLSSGRHLIAFSVFGRIELVVGLGAFTRECFTLTQDIVSYALRYGVTVNTVALRRNFFPKLVAAMTVIKTQVAMGW
jgi:hypothetical protein